MPGRPYKAILENLRTLNLMVVVYNSLKVPASVLTVFLCVILLKISHNSDPHHSILEQSVSALLLVAFLHQLINHSSNFSTSTLFIRAVIFVL